MFDELIFVTKTKIKMTNFVVNKKEKRIFLLISTNVLLIEVDISRQSGKLYDQQKLIRGLKIYPRNKKKDIKAKRNYVLNNNFKRKKKALPGSAISIERV